MHLSLEGNGRLSCQIPCAADGLWLGRQEPGEGTGQVPTCIQEVSFPPRLSCRISTGNLDTRKEEGRWGMWVSGWCQSDHRLVKSDWLVCAFIARPQRWDSKKFKEQFLTPVLKKLVLSWESTYHAAYCTKERKLASLCLPAPVSCCFPTVAAAKSLQSCPTLCDPRDGSPQGSLVPGILQARTLEWVAISFSNAWKWKVKVKLLSHVWPSATPWTAAYQAPLSMGFSRQEYWSGVPLPSPFQL